MSQYHVAVSTSPCAVFRPKRIHVADEHQEAGEMLASGRDAELGSLLDGIDGVAAGIGKTDDLRLGGLRLKQI
jgi:hypothetical protein